jgi:hypothetical protein
MCAVCFPVKGEPRTADDETTPARGCRRRLKTGHLSPVVSNDQPNIDDAGHQRRGEVKWAASEVGGGTRTVLESASVGSHASGSGSSGQRLPNRRALLAEGVGRSQAWREEATFRAPAFARRA